ncbi:hypothetical protein E5Q_00155 [Mixia osmundae IAM 14324]|uniref:Midasin n=1 Tax=Mixia osmundae (strain CBS 9802 / IAM 14324 / JCM 22182 / KY 12970) TaxID=764103 RepID=G7DSF4_MIXOS|nr:hypothetical protein E5Q_00155 [Mixia osmundae IAM 14324]
MLSWSDFDAAQSAKALLEETGILFSEKKATQKPDAELQRPRSQKSRLVIAARDIAPLQAWASLVDAADIADDAISEPRYSGHALLDCLARLSLEPALTLSIARRFEPVLIDIAARLVSDSVPDSPAPASTASRRHALLAFIALARFTTITDNVNLLFLRLLTHPALAVDPFGLLEAQDSAIWLEPLLLALHRLLVALPTLVMLPTVVPQWSPACPPPALLEVAQHHPRRSLRLLAWRVIRQWTGWQAARAEQLKREWVIRTDDIADLNITLVPAASDDHEDDWINWEACTIGQAKLEESSGNFSIAIEHQFADVWVLPALETSLARPHESLHAERRSHCLEIDDLSSVTVDVCGHLDVAHDWLMSSSSSPIASTSALTIDHFVHSEATDRSLRSSAACLSRSTPLLLCSLPSAGKMTMLRHLRATLRPRLLNDDLLVINLADKTLDAKSLLGSLSSSPTQPGSFVFVEGSLPKAMRLGRWLVLDGIQHASEDVLSVISEVAEQCREAALNGCTCRPKLGLAACASLHTGRARVTARPDFRLIALHPATDANPTFLGAQYWSRVDLASPSDDHLRAILASSHPKLASTELFNKVLAAYASLQGLDHSRNKPATLRDLTKWCARIEQSLAAFSLDHVQAAALTNPGLSSDVLLDACDLFLASSSSRDLARATILQLALAVELEGIEAALDRRVPAFHTPKRPASDSSTTGQALHVGRARIPLTAWPDQSLSQRPFALTRPALVLLERIARCISTAEPVLLVGETGTGKTAACTFLAASVGHPLISLNLSNQSETSDLIGGFKPVDREAEAKHAALTLVNIFVELFGSLFSLSRNAQYIKAVQGAYDKARWQRLVGLFTEANARARKLFEAKPMASNRLDPANSPPRKTSRLDDDNRRRQGKKWHSFLSQVQSFEAQYCSGPAKGSKVAFRFVEGPLVRAIREGHWILLDEINLASAETLQALAALLSSATSSLTLTEKGDLEPVQRHPNFRLLACMNPATDVGKRDLPHSLRLRFTEIFVDAPDKDAAALRLIVSDYIQTVCMSDKAVIADVAETYTDLRAMCEAGLLADGQNQPPVYSMRTLARSLSFALATHSFLRIRQALCEGIILAFGMHLDSASRQKLLSLLNRKLLLGRQSRAPAATFPKGIGAVQIGNYFVERGPEPEITADHPYVLTRSVQEKLGDLARAVFLRHVPVLIQGPTSSGKTSIIEHLAQQTGHKFVRINNHEHTDIQEYIGTYVSDATTGKLVFREGLLVNALRLGHWIVLDELNLAPSDVLEALNRLLDDNRELIIPETQEVVRPHPHFMLFATQNPPGAYGGRKVLSRAFRNRFLEFHFDDVPSDELQQILYQRCRMAPSWATKIIDVFAELQRQRQAMRIFEQKYAFATLRDLFRWGDRSLAFTSYEELAMAGFELIGERARSPTDRDLVRSVIESVFKVTLNPTASYDRAIEQAARGLDKTSLVWTSAMKRLFALVEAALRNHEPILLIGETGSGKTSVCQALAQRFGQQLFTVNLHQNTETSDLLGAQRPVRCRAANHAALVDDLCVLMPDIRLDSSPEDVARALEAAAEAQLLPLQEIEQLRIRNAQADALFEWHDGPLVQAMKQGALLLLDEISLADDSVLERLNSMLEPARTLLLAEKVEYGADLNIVTASPAFNIIATMNPGGDFGKKELSPALRNRFTEIWVPSVTDHADLKAIVDTRWRDGSLRTLTDAILSFSAWFSVSPGGFAVTLRDTLAWADFVNATTPRLEVSIAAVHGGLMTLVDGVGAHSSTAGASHAYIAQSRIEALKRLLQTFQVSSEHVSEDGIIVKLETATLSVGSFALSRSDAQVATITHNLLAPTTLKSAHRVLRALQLPKSLLLEGSPGVGKTSLIQSLAAIAGKPLCRINLSDQTDLADLFGSDLPSSNGKAGGPAFAWCTAPFLHAMEHGHWALLDEMNLASQSVLEGLNSCLDHRGTVFVPELDRTFVRHPDFRIFAAQNPVGQGGSRKGLPKSFVDRFTRVYMDDLTTQDHLTVAMQARPTFGTTEVERIVHAVEQLQRATATGHIGRQGGPWDLNLRDVIRWFDLRAQHTFCSSSHLASALLVQRFRTARDRDQARQIIQACGLITCKTEPHRLTRVGNSYVRPGQAPFDRQDATTDRAMLHRCQRSDFAHEEAFEALSLTLSQQWLCVLVGSSASGKSSLARRYVSLTGQSALWCWASPQMDTSDLLGSFQQDSASGQKERQLVDVRDHLSCIANAPLTPSTSLKLSAKCEHFLRLLSRAPEHDSIPGIERVYGEIKLLSDSATNWAKLDSAVRRLCMPPRSTSGFVWTDGPLIQAMRNGDLCILENANLCNASVLDRLNSLFEPNGFVVLAERGTSAEGPQRIIPHSNFRVIMTIDPKYGELSRAMRNRGVEIFCTPVEPCHGLDICTAIDGSLSRVMSTRAFDPSASPPSRTYQAIAATPPSDQALLLRCMTAFTAASQIVVQETLAHSFVRAYGQAARETHQALDLYIDQPVESVIHAATQSDALLALVGIFNSNTRRLQLGGSLHNACILARSFEGGKQLGEQSDPLLAGLFPFLSALFDYLSVAIASWQDTLADPSLRPMRRQLQPILDYALEIERLCLSDTADTSSLRIIIEWIEQNFRQTVITPILEVAFARLRGSMTLRTGLRMGTIWSCFLPPRVAIGEQHFNIFERVWQAAGKARKRTLLELHRIGKTSELTVGEQRQISTLADELKADATHSIRRSGSHPAVLSAWNAAEGITAATLLLKSTSAALTSHRGKASDLVELAIQNLRMPLALLSPFAGHVISRDAANTMDIDGRYTRQEMQINALECLSGRAVVEEGDRSYTALTCATFNIVPAFLRATEHETVINLCDVSAWKGQLHSMARLLLATVDHTTTADALSSLACSLIEEIIRAAGMTSEALDSESSNALDEDDAKVRTILQHHLHDILHHVPDSSDLWHIAKRFFAAAQSLWELYVPDFDLDPLVQTWTRRRFLQQRLDSHCDMQDALLLSDSFGYTDSGRRIDDFNGEIERDRDEILALPAPPLDREPDAASLALFFRDVRSIQSLVLSTSLSDLFESSKQGTIIDAQKRIDTMTDSLAAAHSRIARSHRFQPDLGRPILLALSALQVALFTLKSHIVLERPTDGEHAAAQKLLKLVYRLPMSITSSVDLPTLPRISQRNSAVWQICRVGFLAHFQIISIPDAADAIAASYAKLLAIRNADESRAEQAEADKTSLYRYKDTASGLSEADELEAELAQLFPTYEATDVLNEIRTQELSSEASFAAADVDLIHKIHLRLFGLDPENVALLDSLTTLRERDDRIMRVLVNDLAGASSSDFEAPSLASGLSFLSLALRNAGSVDADFYRGSNAAELSRLVPVIKPLQGRLAELIRDWPDQVILQTIQERCDGLLNLAYACPVARALSYLEQMLPLLDDWAGYASKAVSLAEHQAAISQLIIDWRRQELSAWTRLVEREIAACESAVAPWWFKLLAVITSVPSGLPEQHAHLRELIKLIDIFLGQAPVGQFEARLRLVDSFARYAEKTRDERVTRILRNLSHFYAHSLGKTTQVVQQARSSVTAEINSIIKLASWKDTNTHALRTSAQKSHRQLHKLVRKLRARLNESVGPLLSRPGIPELSSTSISVFRQRERSFELLFVIQPPASLPPHVFSLEQTLHRFDKQTDSLSSSPLYQLDGLCDLVQQIRQESKSLRETQLIGGKEEHAQMAKNLIRLKRRAWAALLKELRRSGLAQSVSEAAALAVSDSVNIHSTGTLQTESAYLSVDHTVIEKADRAFHELVSSLPSLRGLPGEHHEDISSRDLSRAIGSVDTAFAMILRDRDALSAVIRPTEIIETAISILPSFAAAAPGASCQLSIGDVCKQTSVILGELLDARRIAQDHTTLELQNQALLSSLAVDLSRLINDCLRHRDRLTGLRDDYARLSLSVIADSHTLLMIEAVEYLHVTRTTVQGWLSALPTCAYVLRNLSESLRAIDQCSSTPAPIRPSVADVWSAHVLLTNSVLVVSQNLTAKRHLAGDESQNLTIVTHDTALRTSVAELRLSEIAAAVSRLCESASAAARVSSSTVKSILARSLPILQAYRDLADVVIAQHVKYHLALLDLVLLVGVITRELAQRGYCKPSEDDAEQDAGAQEQQSDGTGMGDGTGATNVGDQIENEEQIEGLQDEEPQDNDDEVDQDKGGALETEAGADGREMSISDESDQESGSGDDEEEDRAEAADEEGDVDPLDPDAVDEKMWGDDEDTDKDGEEAPAQAGQEDGPSDDVGAKNDTKEQKSQDNNGETSEPDDQNEREQDDVAAEQPEPELPIDQGETLDLPDDVNLEAAMQDDNISLSSGEDAAEDKPDDTAAQASDAEMDANDLPDADAEAGSPTLDDASDTQVHDECDATNEAQEESKDAEQETTVPDIDAPEQNDEEVVDQEQTADELAPAHAPASADLEGAKQAQDSAASGGHDGADADASAQVPSGESTSINETAADPTTNDSMVTQSEAAAERQGGSRTAEQQQDDMASQDEDDATEQTRSTPHRSLGDALRAWRRQLNMPAQASDGLDEGLEHPPKAVADEDDVDMEYLDEQDRDHSQALAPASEQQALGTGPVAASTKSALTGQMDFDEEPEEATADVQDEASTRIAPERPEAGSAGIDAAESKRDTADDAQASVNGTAQAEIESDDSEHSIRYDNDAVVTSLEAGLSGEEQWQEFNRETRDLCFSLTEQLRLVLAPTLATRLQGDYRTGKRLNMRKIIPYVASDFAKDKIWLRRTKPSARDYQILLALDDSRSMSESNSVRLAFDALALITGALTRLEAGDVAICRFGKDFELLRDFDSGPLTDSAGGKLVDAFTFQQESTDVRQLLNKSLEVFSAARERQQSKRSVGSSASVWQLQIIISDGLCQDLDAISALLRKANSERIMVVFVIIDSLRLRPSADGTPSANSIRNTSSVSYSAGPSGALELKMTRYLDLFPFECYIILQDVLELPEVLSQTVCQFFERVNAE